MNERRKEGRRKEGMKEGRKERKERKKERRTNMLVSDEVDKVYIMRTITLLILSLYVIVLEVIKQTKYH